MGQVQAPGCVEAAAHQISVAIYHCACNAIHPLKAFTAICMSIYILYVIIYIMLAACGQISTRARGTDATFQNTSAFHETIIPSTQFLQILLQRLFMSACTCRVAMSLCDA